MKRLLLFCLISWSSLAQTVTSTTVPVNTNMVTQGKGTTFFNVNLQYRKLANMAALRALPITLVPDGSGVDVLGYYSPGDGGGGTYVLTNSVTGTNAYGGRVLAAGGTKSWELQDEVNILQFGATSSETYNSQPHIQAALDYVKAKGGGTVWGKLGTYSLNPGLLLSDAYGVALRYEARGAAKAITNSFVLRPLGTNLFRGLLVISNTSSVYAGQGNLVDGVYFYGADTSANSIEARTNRIAKGGHGVVLDRVSYSTVENCVMTRLNGDGIYIGDRGCSANKILYNIIELNAGSGINALTLNDSQIVGNIIGNNGVHQFTDETTTITSGIVFDSATSTATLTSGTWDTARFSSSRPVAFYTPLNNNVWDILSISGSVMYLSQAVTDETISPGTPAYATPDEICYGIFMNGNDTIIAQNHIFQTTGHNIYVSNGRDLQIVNNRIDGPTRCNIFLNSGTRNRFAYNYTYDGGVWITDTVPRDPYSLRYTDWATSIRIGAFSSDTIIEGNECYAAMKSTGEENFEHEQYYGIYDTGKATIVVNNKSWNNKHSSYYGFNATGPEIRGNKFQFNVQRGIYLQGTNMIPARITQNVLSYNAVGGIVLDDGASAVISENDFLHASRISTTIRSNIVAQQVGQHIIYPTLNVTNFIVGEPVMVLADRGIYLSQYIYSIDAGAQSLTLAGPWRGTVGGVIATAGNALQTGQESTAIIATADSGSAWMIGNRISLVTTPYSNLGSGVFVVSDSVESAYSYFPNIRPTGLDVIGDSMTTAANKARRLGVQHYTITEEPLGMMFGSSTSSGGTIAIGGGTGVFNAATAIGFYSAANNTTLTGTEVVRFDYSSSPATRDSALQLLDRDAGTLRRVGVTNLDVGDGVTRSYLYLK